MENIISIITICVTLLLGIIGFIVNTYMQRKNNSIKVITESRLKRREDSMSIFTDICAIADINYLDTLTDENEKNETYQKFVRLVVHLRSMYSYCFKADQELVESAFQLKDALYEYFLSGSQQNKQILKERRLMFVRVYDLYIQTEWTRIKMETVGKRKRNFLPKWGKIHDDFQKKYIQLNSVKSSSEK